LEYNVNFKVGIPWTFYYQFMIDGEIQHGTSVHYFILDAFGTWAITILFFMFIKWPEPYPTKSYVLMKKEATEILLQIRNYITDDSNMDWTSYETAEELRKEIDGFMLRLNEWDKKVIEDIYVHFLPTSTFQEHSMQNGWSKQYMELAERFDRIYETHN
jgi:hypothetical protein